jgi:iodotyrosine deiodinase
MNRFEPSAHSTTEIEKFYTSIKSRKTERNFSDQRPDLNLILKCLEIANSAPSGANLQPWHFSLIQCSQVKKVIRQKAESIEFDFYNKRASKEWLDDLKFIGTNHEKPFLEKAPYLIGVFYCPLLSVNGNTKQTYFPIESTGLATGFLLTALHEAGLSSLTYTPKPGSFMNTICHRPKTDRLFMIVVAGYPRSSDTPIKVKQSLESRLSYF